MKNLLLGFVLISIIVVIGLTLFKYPSPKHPYIQIKNYVFSLYLATTPKDQEIGLAKFNSINSGQGMLFIFPKSRYYTFWMKNMKFPIDIIFISKDQIVDIFQNVPVATQVLLPTYTTDSKADKVLEINAGLSKKYGFQKNDKVIIKI